MNRFARMTREQLEQEQARIEALGVFNYHNVDQVDLILIKLALDKLPR